VTIQDPQGLHWGGALAGPVFKKVMSFVLQSERIQPTPASKITFSLTEASLKTSSKIPAKSGAY
jgi:cell division protein FtsI (penicillin-binding protein 3)